MVDVDTCRSFVGRPVREIIKAVFSDVFFLRKLSDDVVCIDGCTYRVRDGVAVEFIGICAE